MATKIPSVSVDCSNVSLIGNKGDPNPKSSSTSNVASQTLNQRDSNKNFRSSSLNPARVCVNTFNTDASNAQGQTTNRYIKLQRYEKPSKAARREKRAQERIGTASSSTGKQKSELRDSSLTLSVTAPSASSSSSIRSTSASASSTPLSILQDQAGGGSSSTGTNTGEPDFSFIPTLKQYQKLVRDQKKLQNSQVKSPTEKAKINLACSLFTLPILTSTSPSNSSSASTSSRPNSVPED